MQIVGTLTFNNLRAATQKQVVAKIIPKFQNPPQVMLAIAGLRTDSSENYTSVKVTTENITVDTFTVVCQVDYNCHVEWLIVSYLAFDTSP